MTPTAGKASDVLERMRRTATKQPAGGNGAGRARPGAEAKVRYTLDLDRTQHHFLKRFALDAGVDASQVMRTLLQLLEDQPTLAAQVLQDLSKRSNAVAH